MAEKYPTWVRIDAKRWESEEQRDGTPDFIATKEADGWRLKWRTSAKATRGFKRITDVKDDVAASLAYTGLARAREDREQLQYCDANAKRGTGTGMCGRPLDEHGYCDRASDHI